MDRCMIYSKGLNKFFQDEDICFAHYILNRVPTKGVLQLTSKEKRNDKKP